MLTISIKLNANIVRNRAAVKTFLATSFVIMTTLGAYVRIPLPFTPVPITLQTFFVILCGAILGKKLGSFTQVSYLVLGGLGMPIFQNYGAGLAHIFGPTGGYLVGFVAAAFIVGKLIGNKGAVLSMFLGLLSIYVCGIMWLVIGYRFSLVEALYLGVIPFVPGAIVKLMAASWIYSKINEKKLFNHISSL